ncbi:MAG TPA: PxKF domain-containing protein [Gaiellaceae bacterium]|nr:PxKF domain-containing protein [Gaiellaceae bacterium]
MRTLLRLSLLTALTALVLVQPAVAESDPTAPQIDLASPADGAGFYQGQHVQAAWGCLPGTLGWPIVSCEGDVPLGAFLDTSSVGTHSFSVHAVDYAGAETTVTHTYTVFDVIPPSATITAPAATDYPVGAQVYASYSCDDGAGGSGVVGCIGTYPNGYPLPTGRPGSFTFTVDAFDAAGNHGSSSVTYRVVDENPPQITITSPADGATYLVGEAITPAFSCHDDVDGSTVPCKASSLDTTPGTHVFRVDSVDSAGNASFETTTYSVRYAFDGFYSPLVAEPGVASFRAGDTVPVKFSLGGDRGLEVVSRAAWRPCGVTTNDSSTAFGSLSYSARPDRYTFMWQSDKSWAGSCRELLLVLRDGTTHAAFVSFR